MRGTLAYLAIVVRAIVSPSVLIIVTLAGALLWLGEEVDAIFLMSVITINTLIAIIQEMRAKYSLDKLSLVTLMPVRRRLADGRIEEISPLHLTVGDVLLVKQGDQLQVDGQLTEEGDGVTVNEALLTGESEVVTKRAGDLLWAGSFLTGGTGVVVVTAVGEQTRSAKITKKLRWFDSRLTPLQASLNATIRWLTIVALVTGVLIYVVGSKNSASLVEILRTIVAGSISLVPEGLVLAATLLFSYGSIRMSRQGVLVRRLGAIEAFGRLNILALDKTGTITDTSPELDRIEMLSKKCTLADVYQGITALAISEGDSIENLPTLQALQSRVPSDVRKQQIKVIKHQSFTSHDKQSWVQYRLANGRDRTTFLLGAPEVLLARLPRAEREAIEHKVTLFAEKGARVVLSLIQKNEEAHPHPLALFLISNALRPGIADTLFYLQANGITLKVISGDNPATVSYIAHKVGIRNHDRILTGDQLSELSAQEWKTIVPATTIFARVQPEQKEKIITSLRTSGFTGMVGDGVNDALAIKKADLGVTVFDSSPATRALADVVLLSNSFKSFPVGVRLGTQIILGIEMVAAVFFNRIAANLMLLMGALALGLDFPLTARHLILINFAVVGVPTILWSLAPAESFGRRDPDTFFKRVLRYAGYNGALTGLGMLLLAFLGAGSTVIVATMYVLGLLTFVTIPRSLGAIDTVAHRFWQRAYLVFGSVVLVVATVIPVSREFFQISVPSLPEVIVMLAVIVGVGMVQIMFTRYWERLIKDELLHSSPEIDGLLRAAAP